MSRTAVLLGVAAATAVGLAVWFLDRDSAGDRGVPRGDTDVAERTEPSESAPRPADETAPTPTPGAGQPGSPGVPSAAAPPARVDGSVFEGVVVEAKGGAPVADVTVSAADEDPAFLSLRRAADGESSPDDERIPASDVPPPGAATTRTGPDGRFRIEWRDAPADVVARKDGYGFGRAPKAQPGTWLELRMEKGEAIRGVVRRRDGKGVGGAILVLRKAEAPEGPPLDRTVSDGRGSFEFRGLARGRYSLRATHGTSMPAALDLVEPSSRPVSIVLAPATRVVLDVHGSQDAIPRGAQAAWRLPVTPWREGKEPLVAREGSETLAWVRIPSEGQDAEVTVTAPGYRPWTSGRLPPSEERSPAPILVALERDRDVADLRLTLVDAAGAPVSPSDHGVILRTLAGDGSLLVGTVHVEAEATGFALLGLRAGTYHLSLHGPRHAPQTVDVAVRPGRDAEERIRLGEPARLLVRIEAPGRRRARFQVERDGKVVPAFAEDPTKRVPGDATAPSFLADASGVWLTGLGSGEHRVAIVSPDLEPDGQTITLTEGAAREVTLHARAKPR